jgi:hypothetical protein
MEPVFIFLLEPTSPRISIKMPKNLIGSAKNRTTKTFLILEEIGQQLLESKHTLTLGHLFKITPNFKNMLLPNFILKRKVSP